MPTDAPSEIDSRTFTYQLDVKSDLRSLLRLFRWPRRLAYCIVYGTLLAAVAPPLLVIAWLAPALVVSLVAVVVVLLTLVAVANRSRVRQALQRQCHPREILFESDGMVASSSKGWLFCRWSWLRRLDVKGGWVGLRHDKTPSYAVLIPQRCWESQEAMEQFCNRVRENMAKPSETESPRGYTTWTPDGESLVEHAVVECQLTSDELARTVTHEVEMEAHRGRRDAHVLLLCLSGAFLLSLLAVDSGRSGSLFGWFVVALYFPYILARILAPWRRRWMGRLFSDPAARGKYRVAVTPAGLSVQTECIHTLYGWEQFQEIVKGVDLFAFRTHYLTLILVPRRAFADAASADGFLSSAQAFLFEQQEKDTTASLDERAAETGNPYQTPLQ